MSDALVTLLAGLGGALIGALAAIAGQMMANRSARRTERRRELVDLVSRFWAVADRLYLASVEFDFARVDEPADSEPEAKAAWARRLPVARDKVYAIQRDARFLIAQMRLLYPGLAGVAVELSESSVPHDFRKSPPPRNHGGRDEALAAYEEEARQLLEVETEKRGPVVRKGSD